MAVEGDNILGKRSPSISFDGGSSRRGHEICTNIRRRDVYHTFYSISFWCCCSCANACCEVAASTTAAAAAVVTYRYLSSAFLKYDVAVLPDANWYFFFRYEVCFFVIWMELW